MAGGGGTRLWPLSTKKLPKQFLNLSGRETLVNEAVDRLLGVADKDDIFIVTNASQTEVMLSQTAGRVKADHILRSRRRGIRRPVSAMRHNHFEKVRRRHHVRGALRSLYQG